MKNTDPELTRQFIRAFRQRSAQSLLLNEAVANRFDMHVTDLQCLNLLDLQGGSLSAGDISRLMALSAGATTRLIDRLEARGYVLRERTGKDRRSVSISLKAKKMEALREVYEHRHKAMEQLLKSYSREICEAFLGFLGEVSRISQDELEQYGSRSAASGKHLPTKSRSV